MRGGRPKTLQLLGGNSWGGGCVLIREYVCHLVRHGWEVHLLSSHPEVIEKMSQVQGVTIIQDIVLPRDVSPALHLSGLVKVQSLCRREQYDVVQTYNTLPSLVGRMAARLAGVPAIFHHQAGWNLGPYYSKLSQIIHYPAEVVGLALSTKSICCSETIRRQADEFKLFPKSHLATICNGINAAPFMGKDSDRGQEFRKKHGIPESAVVVGCHGRLSDLKNNKTLVLALAALREIAPQTPWHLVLAGDGGEAENLARLSADLSLQHQLHLLGYCTEIPEFLEAVDIFAMASLREGMSVSVMEAMAAAKPIVCSSIPQNIELIPSDEFGFTVPAMDASEYARSIVCLWQNPEASRARGLACRDRLLQNYSLEQFLDRTYQLYLTISEARGNPIKSNPVSITAQP